MEFRAVRYVSGTGQTLEAFNQRVNEFLGEGWEILNTAASSSMYHGEIVVFLIRKNEAVDKNYWE